MNNYNYLLRNDFVVGEMATLMESGEVIIIIKKIFVKLI